MAANHLGHFHLAGLHRMLQSKVGKWYQSNWRCSASFNKKQHILAPTSHPIEIRNLNLLMDQTWMSCSCDFTKFQLDLGGANRASLGLGITCFKPQLVPNALCWPSLRSGSEYSTRAWPYGLMETDPTPKTNKGVDATYLDSEALWTPYMNESARLPSFGQRSKTPQWMPWVLCDAETTGEPQWRLMLWFHWFHESWLQSQKFQKLRLNDWKKIDFSSIKCIRLIVRSQAVDWFLGWI